LLLLLYLDCTSGWRSVPLDLSHLSAGSGLPGSCSVFSGVFITEEVDGVGNKGSGDNTVVDLQTGLEAFLNMSLKSACFIDDAFFLVKSNCLCFGTPRLNWTVRISILLLVRLKEFCCTGLAQW